MAYNLSTHQMKATIHPLEVNGSSKSTPRTIVGVDSATNTFVVAGDVVYRFVPGFVFDVVKSSTCNGTYTVASPTQLKIPSKPEYRIVGVRTATVSDVPLAGLLAIGGCQLRDGDLVLVKDNANASQNGVYVAHAGAWSRAVFTQPLDFFESGVYVSEGTNANTVWITSTYTGFTLDASPIQYSAVVTIITSQITVAEPVPVSYGALGAITYNIPEAEIASSIELFGEGTLQIGERFNQNNLNMLTNFAGVNAPVAGLIGQQWFNTTSETLQRFTANGWTGNVDMDVFSSLYRDVVNDNTDVVVGTVATRAGLTVSLSATPAVGNAAFSVLDTQTGEEMLCVEYGRYLRTANAVYSTSTASSVVRGSLVLSDTKTSTVARFEVDGDVRVVGGNIYVDTQRGIECGSSSFKSLIDASGWVVGGSLQVGSALYASGAGTQVGIGTNTPSCALDVVGDVAMSGNLDVTGTLHVSAGHVGINVANPAAELSVGGSIVATNDVQSDTLTTNTLTASNGGSVGEVVCDVATHTVTMGTALQPVSITAYGTMNVSGAVAANEVVAQTVNTADLASNSATIGGLTVSALTSHNVNIGVGGVTTDNIIASHATVGSVVVDGVVGSLSATEVNVTTITASGQVAAVGIDAGGAPITAVGMAAAPAITDAVNVQYVTSAVAGIRRVVQFNSTNTTFNASAPDANVFVYKNGLKLVQGQDYSTVAGVITLLAAVQTTDEVVVYVDERARSNDRIKLVGPQSIVTIPNWAGTQSRLMIFKNGFFAASSEYSVAAVGQDLSVTFVAAPQPSDVYEVYAVARGQMVEFLGAATEEFLPFTYIPGTNTIQSFANGLHLTPKLRGVGKMVERSASSIGMPVEFTSGAAVSVVLFA